MPLEISRNLPSLFALGKKYSMLESVCVLLYIGVTNCYNLAMTFPFPPIVSSPPEYLFQK